MEKEELETEDEVCEFCGGTGEVPTDERDESGNWMVGVGTAKCICKIKEPTETEEE